MNDSIPQPAKWYQFTLKGMLLVILVIAAFLAGRDVAHREMMDEVSSLRKEIHKIRASRTSKPELAVFTSTAPGVFSRQRPSDVFDTSKAVQLGGTQEVTTQVAGSVRYLELDGRRLEWSHAEEGKSGYFYFGFQGNDQAPEWQFAAISERDIRELAGKPLNAHFYGRSTPGGREAIGRTDDSGAIKVAIGDVWLIRTLDDPSTIYVVKIKSQQKYEELTVEYTILQAKD